MAKDGSPFQWETLLDDTEWDREETLGQLLPAQPREQSPSLSRRTPNLLRRIATGVTLVSLLACLVVLWITAEQGANAIDAEISNMIEVENWIRQNGDVAVASSLVDTEADIVWGYEYLQQQEQTTATNGPAETLQQAFVERTRLRSGLAMVQVTVTNESGDAYRETRFYCEKAEGWQRTSPAPVFWGPEHVLETDYFRIRYRQADRQAVTVAATQLDMIYMDLRADLGLTGYAPRLTIEVAPVPLYELGFLQFNGNYLTVPSPLLLVAPIEMNDDALLVQSITYPLVAYLWEEESQTELPEEWRDGAHIWWGPMLRGVQVWQATAGDGVMVSGYRDTATWLYGEVEAIQSRERAPSPIDLLMLCRTGSIWRYSTPFNLSPVALCTSPDWQQELRYHLGAPPDTLDKLFDNGDLHAESLSPGTWNGYWERGIAAVTVVDFFVHEYGRERLRLLVDGFRTHGSWETLIPDVLGVSVAEFEAGWQEFLAEQYGFDHGEK